MIEEKTKVPNRTYAHGIMAAQVVVAEITGDLTIDQFTPGTWSAICAIHAKLAGMAAEAMLEERSPLIKG